MSDKIKIAFFGTPDFGLPSFKSLVRDQRLKICFVVTQPDKKVGRRQILTPPPIKLEALKHNIPIFQPEKIKNFSLPYKIDLIVTAAYGQIIPKNILDAPKYGSINIHGSLLPKYRGASCIQAAILNGDNKTGITIIKMTEKLDAGPIIAQKEIKIKKGETAGELYKRLSLLAAKMIIPVIFSYIQGTIKLEPQNESKASYVGLLTKKDGEIDWNKSATELERFVRAMTPWPGAYCFIKKDKIRVKVIKVNSKILKINKYKIGEIFSCKKKLAVQCGQNALIIEKLQISGKKEISGEEFLRGYQDYIYLF